MNAFESMSEKLSKTGLYDTSEGKLVYAELMAYAEGLDIYYNIIDELLRECFVSTAETYGLTSRENMISVFNNNTDIDGRRKSIISALSVHCTDFIEEKFKKCIDIFNINGTFTYDAENYKMIFECTDDIAQENREALVKQLKAFNPAHLDFEVVFPS